MAKRNVAVTLTERDQQLVELAVLDGDAAAALDFLRRVVKPQMDAERESAARGKGGPDEKPV